MDDIINIVESLEKSGLLIAGVTETVKREIKKQEDAVLGAMMAPMAASLTAPTATSLILPVASSVINTITGKGVIKAGKGQKSGSLPLLLALHLMVKAMTGRDMIKWIIWIKFVCLATFLN